MSRELPEFAAFVLDQLAGLGPVRARPMFGCHGVFCGDRMFGILTRDRLYLKTDEALQERYKAWGMGPFPCGPKSYWEVPADLLENTADLGDLAMEALAVARRAK